VEIYSRNLGILRHGDLWRSVLKTWGYSDMETCGDLYLKPGDTATWRPVENYSKNLELLRHGDLWRSIVEKTWGYDDMETCGEQYILKTWGHCEMET
jgi:hypothetical protein